MKDLLRLLALFRPYTHWMLAGMALSAGVILANVALLALAGWFIAAMALAGLGDATINYFTPAAAIRGLAIVRTVGRYGERLVTHEATLRLLARLRVWFYQRLEPLAPAGLQFHRGGDLLSRIRDDIDSLDNFYLRVLTPTAAAAVTTVLMMAFLALFSVPVMLVNLAGLVLAGVALPFVTQRLGRVPGARAVAVRADLRSSVADTVRGLGELRVFQATQRQGEAVQRLSTRLVSPQRRQTGIDGLSGALSDLIARLSLWLALVLAIPLVARGVLTGPQLAMIALFFLASFEAVSALPAAFQTLGETRAAARRIFALADRQPAVVEPAYAAEPPERFDLCLRGLYLRYGERTAWALDGVELAMGAGERLGIVGPTGSGKTSLFNVLLRFWEYQHGTCEIGGVNLRHLHGETARGLCAVIAQQTHLFNTSIRENLLLVRPDANEADLCAVLRQARVWDEVSALPRGLDTVVGETGTRLSGGQARRVAIARALLKDAPILLLDEPTEGLDAGAEHAVLQALDALMGGRTALLITHRPQALGYMDRVAVMEGGRIIEAGQPEALLRAGRHFPRYASLG